MFITLVVLSLAGVKADIPPQVKPANRLQCLNPVRVNPKQEPTQDTGTDKCLAVPEKSAKPDKVRK
jgi:hypothetical protein